MQPLLSLLLVLLLVWFPAFCPDAAVASEPNQTELNQTQPNQTVTATKKKGGWCSGRKRVNTVGFCSTQLDRLNLAIASEQDQRRPPRRRRFGWGPTLPVCRHKCVELAR